MGRMCFLVVDRHAPWALSPQAASGDLLQPAVGRLVVGALDSHADALAGEHQARGGNHPEAQLVNFSRLQRFPFIVSEDWLPRLRVRTKLPLRSSEPAPR